MTTHDAANAREVARQTDGKFGTQVHNESPIELQIERRDFPLDVDEGDFRAAIATSTRINARYLSTSGQERKSNPSVVRQVRREDMARLTREAVEFVEANANVVDRVVGAPGYGNEGYKTSSLASDYVEARFRRSQESFGDGTLGDDGLELKRSALGESMLRLEPDGKRGLKIVDVDAEVEKLLEDAPVSKEAIARVARASSLFTWASIDRDSAQSRAFDEGVRQANWMREREELAGAPTNLYADGAPDELAMRLHLRAAFPGEDTEGVKLRELARAVMLTTDPDYELKLAAAHDAFECGVNEVQAIKAADPGDETALQPEQGIDQTPDAPTPPKDEGTRHDNANTI